MRASVSLVRYRLADVLDWYGNLEEAEMLYRESLDGDLRLYGGTADHGYIAITRRKLADIALATDRLDQAEELYRKCLEVNFRLKGEKAGASEAAKAFYKLGRKAYRLKALVDAERLYVDCLTSVRQVHVVGFHCDIAIVFLRLSGVLFNIGRIQEAKELFRESMENVSRVYGGTLDSIGFFPDVLEFALDRKQGFYRDCVELHSKLFSNGWDHAGFACVLYELGPVSGNDADKWFRESIPVQQRVLDASKPHSSLADTFFLWADVAKRKGKLDHALNLYARSLAIKRELDGEYDLEEFEILDKMAQVVPEKDDINEAERLYRLCFKIKILSGVAM